MNFFCTLPGSLLVGLHGWKPWRLAPNGREFRSCRKCGRVQYRAADGEGERR
jgi:hypothetical protein